MNSRRLDIPELIEALAGPPPSADAAGRTLLGQGDPAVRLMITAFTDAPTAIRRRIAYLLGKARTKGQHPNAQATLLRALSDSDWKVRRNAAISLGSSAVPSLAASLRAALERETDPTVRPSLMLAFGQLASAADLPWVATWRPSTKEEQRAADTVRARLGAQGERPPTVSSHLELSGDASPELWCRHGLSEVLAEEAQEAGLSALVLDQERVAVGGTPSLSTLLRVRTALFPVLTCDLDAAPEDPATAGRLFAACAVAREMSRLTDSERVTYRLTLTLPVRGFFRRRDWIAGFSEGATGLSNSATGYSWEILARPLGRRLMLGARPATVPDERFGYRRRDVPASLHPTLAAAAVRLLPTAPADIVVDPFCGSGTLLAERAKRGSYARLIGIDHLEQAVSAARENLVGVVRNVDLLRGDFSTAESFAAVTQVITNPPYGHRVGDHAQARRLHRALDDMAARILPPGGHLAVFRPVGFPAPSRLDVVRQLRIDAGGLQVVLWVSRQK